MTPLARRIAINLIRPSSEFWKVSKPILHRCMPDIHCFDVTQALPLLEEMTLAMVQMPERDQEDMIGKHVFLPAPKTWIEWKHPLGMRVALLLISNEAETRADVLLFFDDAWSWLGDISSTSDDWHGTDGPVLWPTPFVRRYGKERLISGFLTTAHFWLVLINSPRIIGRRQFMPDAKLEKKLMVGLGVGKFPLHAWTEIHLKVAKPVEIDDGEPHEAHLTGRRALHFCRKHIRIRRGQLEYVKAHWRGDPALGIRRSTYSVEP